MKWILYVLLLSVTLAIFAFWGLQDPGFIEIRWLGYDVQLSVMTGFLILVFFFCLSLLLKWGLSWLLGMPFRWISFFHGAQERKAHYDLLDLLSASEAENFSEALRHQKKAMTRLGHDPLFLWISGNTFEKAEKPFEGEKCFMELTQKPQTLFLGLKGQIRAALHGRNSRLAQTLLDQAEKLVPTSPWVLKHLLALAREQKNFRRAEELILRLEDLGYILPDQSKRQIAYLHYLEALHPETSLARKEGLLRQSHGLDPSLSEATEALIQLLDDQGYHREALHILEDTWALTPTPTLGDLYLKLSAPGDEVEAYQKVSQLTKKKPKAPESLLLLGRTALKAKLWGEARAHLILLLKQDPKEVVYSLLATLELEENQNAKAALSWLEKGVDVLQGRV